MRGTRQGRPYCGRPGLHRRSDLGPRHQAPAAILRGQPLTLVLHTFNQPLQPIQLTVGGLDPALLIAAVKLGTCLG